MSAIPRVFGYSSETWLSLYPSQPFSAVSVFVLFTFGEMLEMSTKKYLNHLEE